jgi:hypothetical protein
VFFAELIFIYRDVIVIVDVGAVLRFGHVEASRVPPGVPKDVLPQNLHIKLEGTVRQAQTTISFETKRASQFDL